MTQTRKWSLVALVAVLAILAAGWFLLVSPKRGEASDLHAQNSSAIQANDQLRAKLRELQALAPEMPKREAEFAAIRRQIPDNPALPDLIRQLTAAAAASGANLTTVAPSTPTVLTEAAAATTPTATGTTTAASSEQLMQVPLALTVTGSYSELEDYVDRMERLRRVMLVNGFTLTTEGDSGGGATHLTLSLTGRVFMVHAGAPAATTPTAVTGTTASGTTGQTAN